MGRFTRINPEVKLFIKGEDEDEGEDEGAILSSLNSGRFNKLYMSIAFITLANGGDNITIYVPFFSTLNNNQPVITVVTLFIMVAVWCLIGYRLAIFRYVSETLNRFAFKVSPRKNFHKNKIRGDVFVLDYYTHIKYRPAY